MATIYRTQTRRSLLASTSLAVNASKSITTITRSTTTATVTATSHGLSVSDWFVLQGADRPPYNGPFQVATSADANTITYTMESDPGGSAAGTMTLQKALAASIWGDGTTVGGNVTVGALPTSSGGVVEGRIATTTAPTTAGRMTVYVSPTALPGTWREVQSVDGTITANDMSTHRVIVDRGSFALVLFWRVAGTAVFCDAIADEDTYYQTSP